MGWFIALGLDVVGRAGLESSSEAMLLFGTWYLAVFLAFAFAYKFHILYFVLLRSGIQHRHFCLHSRAIGLKDLCLL